MITNLNQVQPLRMRGSIPPLSHTPSCVASELRTGLTVTFALISTNVILPNCLSKSPIRMSIFNVLIYIMV
jgi:hypothetical protein